MQYLVPFLLSFFGAVFLTGVFRRLGIKHKLVSAPRARDIHKKPVPRIGGPAIFISFLVVSILFLVFSSRYGAGIDKHVVGIWTGSLIICGSMLIDDIRGLKPIQKFIFQFLAVVAIISSGIGIETLPNLLGGEPLNLNAIYIPIFTFNGIVYHFSLWSDLLTLVWLVGMMNVINFVDGVDGLAGGVSFIGVMTIFFLSINLMLPQPQTALLAITLAGATAGFLVWNFPPAKIFMGDSGSMLLGFILGALTIVSGGKLATVFLVMGFFIIDGIIVVIGRLIRGENPFTTPDKTHLHHRFLSAGFTPKQAVISLYIISTGFAWVALRSSTQNKMIAAGILVILVILLTLILRQIRISREQK